MSHRTTVEIPCPKCQDKQSVDVWDSINVTLDPSMRQQLFDGKINGFVCEKCSKAVVLHTPLLYHDMHRQFAVQYYPPEAIEDEEFLKEFQAEHLWRHDELLRPESKIPRHIQYPHIVFDLEEMCRYVVFREILAGKKIG